MPEAYSLTFLQEQELLLLKILSYFKFRKLINDSMGATFRCKLTAAYILRYSDDPQGLLRYLKDRPDSGNLSRISRHIFLIAKGTEHLRLGHDSISFQDRGQMYQFRLIMFPDESKATFIHDLYPFVDIFYLRCYDEYEISGKIIIDVGGYIGDTAIYFVKNGAKKVFVYEPNPINFAYLQQNLKMNVVEDQVTPHNTAVSESKRPLIVPHSLGGAGSVHHERKGDKLEVDFTNPKEMFKATDRVDILKIDCKGCEEDIFGVALEQVMSKVQKIIMQLDNLEDSISKEIVRKVEASGYMLDKIDRLYGMVYFSRNNPKS